MIHMGLGAVNISAVHISNNNDQDVSGRGATTDVPGGYHRRSWGGLPQYTYIVNKIFIWEGAANRTALHNPNSCITLTEGLPTSICRGELSRCPHEWDVNGNISYSLMIINTSSFFQIEAADNNAWLLYNSLLIRLFVVIHIQDCVN